MAARARFVLLATAATALCSLAPSVAASAGSKIPQQPQQQPHTWLPSQPTAQAQGRDGVIEGGQTEAEAGHDPESHSLRSADDASVRGVPGVVEWLGDSEAESAGNAGSGGGAAAVGNADAVAPTRPVTEPVSETEALLEVESVTERAAGERFGGEGSNLPDEPEVSALKCLDESGSGVDWWFIYKANNGLDYVYVDPNSKVPNGPLQLSGTYCCVFALILAPPATAGVRPLAKHPTRGLILHALSS